MNRSTRYVDEEDLRKALGGADRRMSRGIVATLRKRQPSPQLFQQLGYPAPARDSKLSLMRRCADDLRQNGTSMLKEYHYDHLIRWPRGEDSERPEHWSPMLGGDLDPSHHPH